MVKTMRKKLFIVTTLRGVSWDHLSLYLLGQLLESGWCVKEGYRLKKTRDLRLAVMTPPPPPPQHTHSSPSIFSNLDTLSVFLQFTIFTETGKQ